MTVKAGPPAGAATPGASGDDPRLAIVLTYFKHLRLPAMARECVALAREAEQHGLGYLGYLQTLLEQEVAQRHENQLRQRLKAAAFPTEKRLTDFDFSLVPSVPKTRLLYFGQAAFLTAHDSVVLLGPSGLGKTHLIMGLAPAPCLAGAREVFRT